MQKTQFVYNYDEPSNEPSNELILKGLEADGLLVTDEFINFLKNVVEVDRYKGENIINTQESDKAIAFITKTMIHALVDPVSSYREEDMNVFYEKVIVKFLKQFRHVRLEGVKRMWDKYFQYVKIISGAFKNDELVAIGKDWEIENDVRKRKDTVITRRITSKQRESLLKSDKAKEQASVNASVTTAKNYIIQRKASIANSDKNQTLHPTVDNNGRGKIITPVELLDLMCGQRMPKGYENVVILDARFPFEYDSGHIYGSINMWRYADMVEKFFHPKNIDNYKRTVFVFTCEFCSSRGPGLAAGFRDFAVLLTKAVFGTTTYDMKFKDEPIDKEVALPLDIDFFPHLYYINGGYNKFFEAFPEVCTPQNYLSEKNAIAYNRILYYNKTQKKASGGIPDPIIPAEMFENWMLNWKNDRLNPKIVDQSTLSDHERKSLLRKAFEPNLKTLVDSLGQKHQVKSRGKSRIDRTNTGVFKFTLPPPDTSSSVPSSFVSPLRGQFDSRLARGNDNNNTTNTLSAPPRNFFEEEDEESAYTSRSSNQRDFTKKRLRSRSPPPLIPLLGSPERSQKERRRLRSTSPDLSTYGDYFQKIQDEKEAERAENEARNVRAYAQHAYKSPFSPMKLEDDNDDIYDDDVEMTDATAFSGSPPPLTTYKDPNTTSKGKRRLFFSDKEEEEEEIKLNPSSVIQTKERKQPGLFSDSESDNESDSENDS